MKLGALFLVVLGVLVAAPAASADKPVRLPVVFDDLVLEGVCAFPVEVDVLVNRQTFTEFSDGRQAIQGIFKARFTNLDGGGSTALSLPGPLFFSPNPDGTWNLKGTGRNVFFFFPGELGPGEPGALLLLTGRTTELLDADFFFIPGTFRHKGGVVDLCAQLA